MYFKKRHQKVCRTCLKVLAKSQCFNLYSTGLSKIPTTMLLDKLRDCVPELDLKVIPQASVCGDCAAAIDLAYSFKTKCLQTDGLIHSYSKNLGISNVDLNKLICYYDDPRVTNSVRNKSYSDDCEILNVTVTSTSKVQNSLHRDKPELNSEITKQHRLPCSIDDRPWKQNTEALIADVTLLSSTEEKNVINFHEQSFNGFSVAKTEIEYRTELPLSRMLSLSAVSSIDLKCHELSELVINESRENNNLKENTNISLVSQTEEIEQEHNLQTTIISSGLTNTKDMEETKESNSVNSNLLLPNGLPSESPKLSDSNYLNRQQDQTKIITYPSNPSAYNTNSKETFNDHLKKHTEKNFKCDICGYRTNHWINFDKHNCAGQERNFECHKCNYKTKYRSVLTRHVQNHMKNNINTEPNKRTVGKEIKCDFSGPRSKLPSHKRTHMLEKYKCASCNFKTAKKSLLQTHTKSHFSTITYECDVCSYIALTKSGLNRHKMAHTKPFKCLICGYKTSANHWLQNHMKKHF